MEIVEQKNRHISLSNPLLALTFIWIVFQMAACALNNVKSVNKLSFVSDQGGKPQIYVMNDDGTNKIRLTKIGNPEQTVNLIGMFAHGWSPDGKYLAFASDMDAGVNRDIYRMDADGSNIKRLTFCEERNCFRYFPAWSPDGTKIAFSSISTNGLIDMYIVNIDGSSEQRITYNVSPIGGHLFPYWSPDGKHIIYYYSHSVWTTRVESGFYVIDKFGLNRNLILNDEGEWYLKGCPTQTSDRQRIAFSATSSKAPSQTDIYVVNIDGTGFKRLTNSDSNEDNPRWRP
jgi:Tol biopolymer transport system component